MLAREPELNEDERVFLNAYTILHHQAGSNPISISDMLAYCHIYGHTDIEGFIEVIVACDVEFLAAVEAHQQKEIAQMKAKSKRKKGK